MNVIFRVHALQRMYQRGIEVEEVLELLRSGEVIKDYPTDEPLPSRLLLGYSKDKALHVVAADDRAAGVTIVITVYEPDPKQWDPTFKRRLAE